MTPKQRDKFICDSLLFWRKTLGIDPNLKIKIKYVTHREEDPDRTYAQIYTNMVPYGQATIEIFDEVFMSKDFQQDADSAICHELLHLVLNPMVSYCGSFVDGQDGASKYLESIEEATITKIERALGHASGRYKAK